MKRLLPALVGVSVLVGGLIHLKLYYDGYKDFPNDNLGRSFLANAVVAALLAGLLIGGVRGRLAEITWLGTVLWGGGTLIAFALSRTDSGIFDFTETGWNPSPEAAIGFLAEVGAVLGAGAGLLLGRLEAGDGDPRSTAIPTGLEPAALRGPGLGVVAAGVLTVVLGFVWADNSDDADKPEPAVAGDDGTTATTGAATDAAADGGAFGGAYGASDGSAPAGDIVDGEVQVTIEGFAFTPQALTIPAGTTVTWTNQDGFAHNQRTEDASFDSPDLGKGESFSYTFDAPGTFPYICGIHNSMTASIVVE